MKKKRDYKKRYSVCSNEVSPIKDFDNTNKSCCARSRYVNPLHFKGESMTSFQLPTIAIRSLVKIYIFLLSTLYQHFLRFAVGVANDVDALLWLIDTAALQVEGSFVNMYGRKATNFGRIF